MAREKRAERRAAKQEEPVEIMTQPVPWDITEEIHVTCPLCSLLAKSDFFLGGPYGIEVKLKRYGGSMKSPTGRMRQRAGFMEYEPQPELIPEWQEKLRTKLQEVMDSLGQHPELPAPSPRRKAVKKQPVVRKEEIKKSPAKKEPADRKLIEYAVYRGSDVDDNLDVDHVKPSEAIAMVADPPADVVRIEKVTRWWKSGDLDREESEVLYEKAQHTEVKALIAKWEDKAKNIFRLRNDLDKLRDELGDRENDYDFSVVESTMDEYDDMKDERSDYADAEEYQDARNEKWEEIFEEFKNLVGDDE